MEVQRPGRLPALGPQDQFSFGPSVIDFWQWAISDLRMNNVRGYLAEFMVATATDSPTPSRIEWAPYDVLTGDGVRVEVKASGYLQSWSGTKPSTPRWTFKSVDAASYWDEEAATSVEVDPFDRVDAWVFALQTCRDPDGYQPLDASQWEFRVVPHRTLLSVRQRSIGISGLEAAPLRAKAVPYERLAEAIDQASALNADVRSV